MSPDEIEKAIADAVQVLSFAHPLTLPAEVIAGFAALGWDEGHQVICGWAKQLTLEGKPLPLDLQQYVVAVATTAHRRRSRGGDPFTNFARDIRIKTAIQRLLKRGFDATRNDASKHHECACSIVSTALERLGLSLSEKAVVKIWGDRNGAVRNK